MLVAVGAFVWLYQATMLDSRYAARWKLITEAAPNPAPTPGSELVFTATAFSLKSQNVYAMPPRHTPSDGSCRSASATVAAP